MNSDWIDDDDFDFDLSWNSLAGAMEPATNINGLPMIAGAGIDITGHAYGDPSGMDDLCRFVCPDPWSV